jgi:hypothetical protein
MARLPEPPKDSFGKAVAKGAGYGAMAGLGLSVENPNLAALALGSGVGAIVGGARNIKQSLTHSGAVRRRNEQIARVQEIKAGRKAHMQDAATQARR